MRRGEPTTLTLADGSYEFVDLEAGAYVVREVVPDGWLQTFPQTVDVDCGAEAVAIVGQLNCEPWFGFNDETSNTTQMWP